MKIIFLILILVHGLIHILGFVKAFGISDVKELNLPISKPLGVVWLVTSILFALVALLFAMKNSHWWLFAFIAIFISQALIIYFWQDAKFGTIANILILLVTIIGSATWSFSNKYEKEVVSGLQQTALVPDSILTETDIENLPSVVQNYIRYTGSIGKPKVKNFKAEFTGKIRRSEQSEWMPFTTEQYNFLEASTRLFFMKAVMKHMPVAGFHNFTNGDAYMDIRLFSLFTVQYESGREMGIAETVTFFNDMCCIAPATLIDKRIKWSEEDSIKVKAEFTNNNITISAWLYFNEKGELINFISEDRYAVAENDKMKKIPWSTPLKDYMELNGYKQAGYADLIYSYPEGDFCYGTFSLTNIEYNPKNFKY